MRVKSFKNDHFVFKNWLDTVVRSEILDSTSNVELEAKGPSSTDQVSLSNADHMLLEDI